MSNAGPAGGAAGGGGGGKQKVHPHNNTARKQKRITAVYAVNDRVVYGIIDDNTGVVAYHPASIVRIIIDMRNCLYSILLDKGNRIDNIAETELFKL
jgi:hypothetical protein